VKTPPKPLPITSTSHSRLMGGEATEGGAAGAVMGA
jgi:hypothetical protein